MKDMSILSTFGFKRHRALHLRLLTQFHKTWQRWFERYDGFANEVITQAAVFQLGLFRRQPDLMDSPMLFGDHCPISLALNCLVVLRSLQDLFRVGGWGKKEVYREGGIILQDPCHWAEPDWLEPLIKSERKEGGFDRSLQTPAPPGLGPDAPLGRMLEHIGYFMQQLQEKQDPEDWPTVLYVICILRIAVKPAREHQEWTTPLMKPFAAVDALSSDLCRLYYISTKGGHPLTSGSTPCLSPAYEALAAGHAIAVEHYGVLHDEWLRKSEFCSL
jgi:hypothetical protein